MARKKDETPTTRVVQLWPEELKNKVQEVTGPRGLTKFTIEAVEAALAALPEQEPAPVPSTPEQAEEAVATAPEPVVEPGGYAEPEGEQAASDEGDEDDDEPEDEGRPAFMDPLPEDKILTPIPVDESGPNGGFFDRVQAKAAELGVSVTKASDLPKPSATPFQVPEKEPAQIPSTPEPAPAEATVAEGVCPKCGDELVENECWSCGWAAA